MRRPLSATASRADVGVNALPGEGFDQPRRVDAAIGCSLLIAADALARIGLLDEAYFAYHEEIDWCVRARKAGYYLYYQPFSRVCHHYSKSTDVARPRPHAARRPQGVAAAIRSRCSGTRCGPISARATPCASSAGTRAPLRTLYFVGSTAVQHPARGARDRARSRGGAAARPAHVSQRAGALLPGGGRLVAETTGRRPARCCARSGARRSRCCATCRATSARRAREGLTVAGGRLRARPLGRRSRTPAAARAARPAMTGGVGGPAPGHARGGADMTGRDVTIVVLNWNGGADTVDCLESLRAGDPGRGDGAGRRQRLARRLAGAHPRPLPVAAHPGAAGEPGLRRRQQRRHPRGARRGRRWRAAAQQRHARGARLPASRCSRSCATARAPRPSPARSSASTGRSCSTWRTSRCTSTSATWCSSRA